MAKTQPKGLFNVEIRIGSKSLKYPLDDANQEQLLGLELSSQHQGEVLRC